MLKVEQIDLFEVLEKMVEQQVTATSTPLPIEPISVSSAPKIPDIHHLHPPRMPIFYRCVDAISWPWHFATSLFGLGVWVNVYTVTRAFGGRENGGWCYLNYECEHAKQVGIWEAETLRQYWEKQYLVSHKWGDLYSKSGGQDVVVLIEKRRAASRTRCKPQFEESAAHLFPYSLVQ
ncbi:hypothetical protein L1N85_24605 [Paenibacillus alkaliterrae]|uniref:hypothetical protein n=1 Tax=Paenibacillus alkaliterrae TaxID=320909 RepID=UPI001F15C8C1|nr:hypothetical protein [Paenibacillus alkaliterrae]MCF2941523.1 hypothetical protein [Paenibacillus alkaliterrae]